MKIYKTDLDTTDFDLENQLMLEAKVKYALATEHTHLLDCNGMIFAIYVEGDEIILNECCDEDEVCVPCTGAPEVDDCDDCEEPVDPIEDIIDLILRNSLLSSEPIRKEPAETMLILAHLKATLSSI